MTMSRGPCLASFVCMYYTDFLVTHNYFKNVPPLRTGHGHLHMHLEYELTSLFKSQNYHIIIIPLSSNNRKTIWAMHSTLTGSEPFTQHTRADARRTPSRPPRQP